MAKQVPSLTEWRIIGVSGATADGREISASELKEMAETYDPEIYTAKINLEHFRFLYDSWEGAYGDVRELKAEPWAKDPSKTALLAKFSVLPALQNVWDKGSKSFYQHGNPKQFCPKQVKRIWWVWRLPIALPVWEQPKITAWCKPSLVGRHEIKRIQGIRNAA